MRGYLLGAFTSPRLASGEKALKKADPPDWHFVNISRGWKSKLKFDKTTVGETRREIELLDNWPGQKQAPPTAAAQKNPNLEKQGKSMSKLKKQAEEKTTSEKTTSEKTKEKKLT